MVYLSLDMCGRMGEMDKFGWRRVGMVLVGLVGVGVWVVVNPENWVREVAEGGAVEAGVRAVEVLERLEVKGRAPRTGYSREEFYTNWPDIDGCDARNVILARDLTEVVIEEDGNERCIVLAGVLDDPYTGERIEFVRGSGSSSAVQIDHVVALSDAWQKGAQYMEQSVRKDLAGDPLNLLAVDGPANMEKGDSDAASWLPSNKAFRCTYVARQISVKYKYKLWVTEAERDAMGRVLEKCPDEPTVGLEGLQL
jgi:hypothetical protein